MPKKKRRRTVTLTRRKHTARRHRSGKVIRSTGPDRGTDEMQARREMIAGDPKAPVDLNDPIDVLHRGSIRHLEAHQAEAAARWRRLSARVMEGEGPKLAMLREPTGAAREIEPEIIARARADLDAIDDALELAGKAIKEECVRVVQRYERPKRLDDLKHGLNVIAWATGLI